MLICGLLSMSPDTFVVSASVTGHLQANSPVVGPLLSIGKLIRMVVTTMGSNVLIVGKDHLVEPSCQRCICQTGMWGSMAFGSSAMGGKTLISSPAVLRKYPFVKNTSVDIIEEKSGVESIRRFGVIH